MKKKIKKTIAPKFVSQHIEEEFRKDREFRRAYDEEVVRLQIGYKIAKLRKLRKISQAQLAKRIETSQQTISRLEEIKDASVNLRTLAKVAGALNARLKIEFVL